MTHGDPDFGGAGVVSLACARFEEALAEGRLDAAATRHRAACARCRALAEDVAALTADLAAATAPRPLPADFAAGVLQRAAALEGEIHAPIASGSPAVPRRNTRATPWAFAFGAAAAVALAFWAGTLFERGRAGDPPTQRAQPGVAQRVAVGVAPDVPPPALPEVAAALPPAPAAAPDPVVLRPEPTPEPPRPAGGPPEPLAVPEPAEVAPEPAPEPAPERPEPKVDFAAELSALIRARIGQIDLCPAHSDGSVRVTLRVEPDGHLSDRQVLSYAGHRNAHVCINYALDQLVLPPLDKAREVTLDLRW